MEIYTLQEIYNLAGCYDADSDLERDLKVSAYLAKRKYRVIENWPLHHDTVQDQDVEILIVKGNKNGRNQPRHHQASI